MDRKELSPCTTLTTDQIAKLKRDTEYRFKVVRERNYEFHKKVLALFNLGFENQEKYKSFEHYRKVTTMKAGYYEAVETDKGTIYLPDSLSFASMNQDTFEALFERLLDAVADQLQSKPFEIRNQLDDFM